MSFMRRNSRRMYHSTPPVRKTSNRYKRKVCVTVCVFLLMRGWIQVLTLERNSLMCVILEMQMAARVNIHR